MLADRSNSTIKYRVYKNLTIFLVVANNKQFMHLPQGIVISLS